MNGFSAYFFDLGGTLVALEKDEVALDGEGRVSLLPSVEARLKALAGQPIFVITNQSGVALGTLTEAQARGFIEQVNRHVGGVIQDYRICMHHPDAGCGCRKPQPGMLLDLAAVHGVDLSQAVMVGDSSSDQRCALAAGVGNFIWADAFFERDSSSESVNFAIRLAELADLPAIVAIYNAAIPAHTATADLEPVSVESRQPWFAGHDPRRRPLWAAVDDRNEVIGWLSFSTFYDRAAWDPTVEVSYYVRPDQQRRGIGRALLNHAVAAAPALGISNIMAIVSGHNEASIGLLESAGFERWGHLPEVVYMPEGRRDVLIFGRKVG